MPKSDMTKTEIDDLLKTLGPMAIQALLEGKAAVVPIEPTRVMWSAGGDAVVQFSPLSVHHDKITEAVWTAMLAAGRIDALADQP